MFGSDIISNALRGEANMPAFNKIDLGTEQQKAINANQSSLPAAEELASGVNKFNMEQLENMLEQAMPGWRKMQGKAGTDISSMLSGEIPQDVNEAITNSAAARSLGSGTAGSGMARNLVARDLGLTSLQEIDKGISSAESWMKTSASIFQPSMMNVSSMFVTPEQMNKQDTEERNAQFQHDWAKDQMDWQSSFGYAAGADVDSTTQFIADTASGIVGKM
jgi:hypothetical protein